MKKNNVHLLAIALIMLWQNVFAQSPGYLGKRVAISAETNFCPLIGYLINNDEIDDFNWRYAGGIDYVVSNYQTIGLKVETMNDDFKYKSYITADDYYNSSYYYYDQTYKATLNTTAIIFSLKTFNLNKGAIAPLGNYAAVELGYLFGNFDVNGFNVSSTAKQVEAFLFTYGMSSRVIYKSRIFVDIGFKAGLAINGNAKYFLAEVSNIKEYKALEKRSATGTMLTNYLFSIQMAIGFIP
jgi:hypothetical protein